MDKKYNKILNTVNEISSGHKLLFNHNSVIKEYDELDLIKIGYIEYKQYIIPICINKTTDKELREIEFRLLGKEAFYGDN